MTFWVTRDTLVHVCVDSRTPRGKLPSWLEYAGFRKIKVLSCGWLVRFFTSLVCSVGLFYGAHVYWDQGWGLVGRGADERCRRFDQKRVGYRRWDSVGEPMERTGSA